MKCDDDDDDDDNDDDDLDWLTRVSMVVNSLDTLPHTSWSESSSFDK